MVARVLWLTKGLGLGGAERLITLMAPRLDRSHFQIEVAYVLPWKDALVDDLETAGIPTVCLDARRTTDPRWPVRLRKLLRQRYDIVHTHSPVPAVAARLFAPQGTALVHTEHNVWDRYRWGTYATNAATYRRNTAVIAVSDGVALSVEMPWWAGWRSAPSIEALHHGVDVDHVPRGPEARVRARQLLDLAPTVPVIGTVANFTPKKDHAGLLAAIDEVRRDIDDLVALFIGSGPLESDLRAEVVTRRLERHVRFLGSRDDVLELLPALDLFVLGSRFEGLPISLLEAMAAGVPAVTTSVGGIPEAMEDGRHGLLVPPGDPSALAWALRTLLKDSVLRAEMASAVVDHVRERFSVDRASRRIEAMYAAILVGKPALVARSRRPRDATRPAPRKR